jgi:hypothetical protein
LVCLAPNEKPDKRKKKTPISKEKHAKPTSIDLVGHT